MSTELRAPRRLADEEIIATARRLALDGGTGFAAPQLLSVLCAADATQRDVLRLISADPGLTARVLRVANSALHGVRGKVGTADHAVRLLGLDAVRGIAAAACFNRGLGRSGAQRPIDVDAYQAHCVATAVAAESLARMRAPALVAEAFVAGLLHDFGVLVQLHSDLRLPRLRGADGEGAKVSADDLRALHEHYGAVALEAWGLPSSLVAVARHHHNPLAAAELDRELAALVLVADCASRTAGLGFDGDGTPIEIGAAVANAPAIGVADVEMLVAELPERVAAWRAALG